MKTAKKKRPKKKLSGSGFRKLRRQKLADAKGVAANLIKMPYVGRLETVSDWHTQIARLYRRTLSGEIPEYVATKLVYIATAGATIAKAMQEIKELELLRLQVEQTKTGQYIPAQELLPASQEGDE